VTAPSVFHTGRRDRVLRPRDGTATFHWLIETGAIKPGQHMLHCPAGRVPIEVEAMDGDGVRVWMGTPLYPWEPSPIAGASLMGLLGGSQGCAIWRFRSAARKERLRGPLQARRLSALPASMGRPRLRGGRHQIGGFYVFTGMRRSQKRDRALLRSRVRHPRGTRPPDRRAGRSPVPRAPRRDLTRGGGWPGARSRRAGTRWGKPGRVDLEVAGAAGKVESVRVGGMAVTVLEGLSSRSDDSRPLGPPEHSPSQPSGVPRNEAPPRQCPAPGSSAARF
jgi:hypothetical protein